MSEAILRIKYWGNNLGVRLPAVVARQAKLRAEQSVHVTVEGGGLSSRRLREIPLRSKSGSPGSTPCVMGARRWCRGLRARNAGSRGWGGQQPGYLIVRR